MSDPYKILGLTSSATTDEVKKAYRKLAMKFHPDRNDGKDTKFKEIQAAYEQVKDGPPKPATSAFHFDFKTGEDFTDILRKARYQHQMQVSVSVHIPLKDAVTGGERPIRIPIHGKEEDVIVKIPEGLMNGEMLRYHKLVNGVDVLIKYHIMPDPVWEINKFDLIKHQSISIWDLILGGPLDVMLLDGTTIRLRIPPNTQPNTNMRVGKKGILNRTNGVTRGDMFVRLEAKIPKDIPEPLLSMIRENHTK